jgi:hypothetical protein
MLQSQKLLARIALIVLSTKARQILPLVAALCSLASKLLVKAIAVLGLRRLNEAVQKLSFLHRISGNKKATFGWLFYLTLLL